MWHAATGPIAAPFAPVFLGQADVPPEFGPHRYLTVGESHRFVDMRKAVSGGIDTVSRVPQAAESFRSAVYESKRLMYLMQLLGPDALKRAVTAFEASERQLARQVAIHLRIAEAALAAGLAADVRAMLGDFSTRSLISGLNTVTALAGGLEVELAAKGPGLSPDKPVAFPQIW